MQEDFLTKSEETKKKFNYAPKNNKLDTKISIDRETVVVKKEKQFDLTKAKFEVDKLSDYELQKQFIHLSDNTPKSPYINVLVREMKRRGFWKK